MDVSKRENVGHVETYVIRHAGRGISLLEVLGGFEIAVEHLVEFPVIGT